MKNLSKVLSLLLILTLTLVTSCKKKKEDTLFLDNTFTMKIDNGEKANFKNIITGLTQDKEAIKTIATKQDYGQMIFLLDPDINPGTYTGQSAFDDDEIAIIFSGSSGGLTIDEMNISMSSFTFEVVSHDKSNKHIKGSFGGDYTDNNNATHTFTCTFDLHY